MFFGLVLVVVFGLVLLVSVTRSSRNSRKGKARWIPPWEDSSEIERWSQSLLNELEWKRFEQVISHFYKLRGFRSKVTRMGADGGVDVVLYEEHSQTPHTLIQCKSWSQKVGVKPIRELFGVMAADGIKNGIFATTSEYTGEARQWAEGKSIQLLSGASIVGMFNGLEIEQIKDLLEVGLSGDFRTPTCPSCDVKMVERTARKGKSAGSSFWGCRNYPRCKQTFKVT
tara:strand:+ start:96 stop:776 length:681 start_codon:yes stop_codon:yes gene_type:complete